MGDPVLFISTVRTPRDDQSRLINTNYSFHAVSLFLRKVLSESESRLSENDYIIRSEVES